MVAESYDGGCVDREIFHRLLVAQSHLAERGDVDDIFRLNRVQ